MVPTPRSQWRADDLLLVRVLVVHERPRVGWSGGGFHPTTAVLSIALGTVRPDLRTFQLLHV